MFESSFFTIPAFRPFVRDLAAGIVRLAPTADQLARVRILLPNRRSAATLKAAFIDILDGRAHFLPQMMPIGDVDETASDILATSLLDPASHLVPPLDETARHLILARLVRAMRLSRPHAGSSPIAPAGAFALAASLAEFIDQTYHADSPIDELEKIIPAELAQHWDEILQFLQIVLSRWPDILNDMNRQDPTKHRLALMDLQIESWRNSPPETPVILAGSTGSLPKTQQMMQAVAALPKGMVVFPGPDACPISDEDIKAIEADSGHPMHQIMMTCRVLDLTINDLTLWPVSQEPVSKERPAQKHVQARRALLTELFRPAPQTRKWRSLKEECTAIGPDSLDGLRLIYADDMHHEAHIITALMRQTLEHPDKTAMLVTPDRKLARYVRGLLLKWDIDVDDSAGTPLIDTRTGQYLKLLIDWGEQGGTASSLLALAKHPFSSGGLSKGAFDRSMCRLERAILRGYLTDSSAQGIRQAIKDSSHKDKREMLEFYEAHILRPLAPILDLKDAPHDLANLADAHGQAAESLVQTEVENEAIEHLWGRPDGRMAVSLFKALAESRLFPQCKHELKLSEYGQVFTTLCAEHVVRKPWTKHPRLNILSPVEARMMMADLVILSSVNEGVWPPHSQGDPWINETIRKALNLPNRQWRTGLSAHDFFMMASQPEVIITRSDRTDDTLTIRSRWLIRLDAVLRATALEDKAKPDVPDDIAAAINAHKCKGEHKPITRPLPCPELALRPRRLSATELDVLIGDPYQIYAKKILKLRALDAIDKRPDAALRGTLIHEILAEFIREFPIGQPLPEEATEHLVKKAEIKFSPYFAYAPVKNFWMKRFMLIADWFVKNEEIRRMHLQHSFVEIKGSIDYDTPFGVVMVTAKADRLDIDREGHLAIIDYKTGRLPSAEKVKNGRATQLLTEAVIAHKHGFGDMDKEMLSSIDGLEYWHLKGNKTKPAEIKHVMPSGLVLDDVDSHIAALVRRFDHPDAPYESEPDPAHRPDFSDYRHLARVREWRPEEVGDD